MGKTNWGMGAVDSEHRVMDPQLKSNTVSSYAESKDTKDVRHRPEQRQYCLGIFLLRTRALLRFLKGSRSANLCPHYQNWHSSTSCSRFQICYPMAAQPISVGPWGGDGGDTWDDVLYSGIHKIRVGYDEGAIVSIHIEYDNNGNTVWREHGGRHHDEEIELDYPQEILISISGYYDTYLRSLTFESNLEETYGPYGREEGTYFSFPISDGKIVSFHGRSDEYLRSIGVHLSNLHAAVPPLCVKVGPWGLGEGGVIWDDGASSGIRVIRLSFDHHGICSIGIEYDHHGSSFWLENGNTTKRRYQFNLNPGSILTSISGYYDDTGLRRRLIFGCNRQGETTMGIQRIGPSWKRFSIPIMNGKIVGFHGRRSDEYLRAIGVYLSN